MSDEEQQELFQQISQKITNPEIQRCSLRVLRVVDEWEEALLAGDLTKANEVFQTLQHAWSLIWSIVIAEQHGETAHQYTCSCCGKFFSQQEYYLAPGTTCSGNEYDREPRRHTQADLVRFS